MLRFLEKKKIRDVKTVLVSWTFLFFLFCIACFMLLSAYERYAVERETAQKLEERMNELRLIEEREATLQKSVEHMKNERGIEEEIRNRFDVAKEGEEVVIILEDEKTNMRPLSTSSASSTTEKKRHWYDIFFW